MSRKVLILSSALGGGHQSTAEALTEIIQANYPATQIKTANMSPPLGSPVYRFLSNSMTEVFVKNWHAFNNKSNAKLLHLLSTPLVMAKLTPLLKQFSPDLIIATHAFSTVETYLTLKQLGIKIPLVIVLVDPFSIHHAWTTFKLADRYLLPNLYSFRIFKQRGVDPQRLTVTGHPIRPIPSKLLPLRFTGKKLTVFLGGSGEGVGRIDQIVTGLWHLPGLARRVRLLVVCGKNNFLYSQMQFLARKMPDSMRVYGFTDQIYRLIKSADIVVGKAGPNLMFEALALGKPILATGLPLGQEAGNYRFIAREKVGIVASGPEQTVRKLILFIRQPRRLCRFQPAIKKQQQLIRQTPPRILAGLRPFLQA